MRDEGTIKFDCEWIDGPAPEWHKIHTLNEWRQLMYDVGLIGAYDDGIGFGNISIRDTPAHEFIITGSTTGNLRTLRPEHFTRVLEHDFDLNRVLCRGPIEASSESLTHAAFYVASRSINAVIHIHHKELWQKYLDRLPTTSPEITYGTPEMAHEVLRLLKQGPRPSKQLVIMGGHDEGVMAYGNSLGHAASILLNCCNRLFRPPVT
ncbi:MAG: class II aldolase/adducin family protein [Bacteroidetes bacterium]|nr:MAG: class II aldolase/adducin family protein [Bacteroidota bacterium]